MLLSVRYPTTLVPAARLVVSLRVWRDGKSCCSQQQVQQAKMPSSKRLKRQNSSFRRQLRLVLPLTRRGRQAARASKASEQFRSGTKAVHRGLLMQTARRRLLRRCPSTQPCSRHVQEKKEKKLTPEGELAQAAFCI